MSWRVAGVVGVLRAHGRVGITKEEIVGKLKALVLKRTGGTDVASQKRFFAMYDTNKDGKLEKAELSQILDDAEACAWVGCDMTAGKVIEEVDRDGDGKISWAEYSVTAGIVETAGTPGAPKDKGLAEIIAALDAARKEVAIDEAKKKEAEEAGPLTPATTRAEEQGGDFMPVLVSLVSGALAALTLGTVAAH